MANTIKKYLDTAALEALVTQIKAEDDKVKAYADKAVEDAGKLYDTAGSAATAEKNAKDYTDALASGQVATNKADIAKLNGDANTDGSVAKKIADAKTLIDADVDAVEAIANQNKTDIAAINNETTGILAQAKTYADGKASEVQGNVDTLSGTVEDLAEFVGDIPEGYTEETVIAYINKKSEETLAAAQGGSSETAASVKQQLDNYKSENNTKVNKNTEDIAALQTALDEEVERADAAEKANAASIKAISDDYLKGSDKTELEGKITANANAIELLTNGVSAEEVDGVNDLIQYVKDHGTEVTGMQGDIADNASAIEGVAGRMDTAEGKITAVEGAVATKAEKTYVDEKVQALQGEDTTIKGRLDALESAIGESGSVADDIATAKQEAIDAAAADATTKAGNAETAAKGYTDSEIDKVEGTIATLTETVNGKAAQSEVTTISGKVGTLETDMAQAKTDIDNVEAKAGANETAIGTINTELAKKAAQTDLDNAVGRIAQNETDIAALEEASATHALASDLTTAIGRIAANETAIAANTSAINSFTAITADEVNALFA